MLRSGLRHTSEPRHRPAHPAPLSQLTFPSFCRRHAPYYDPRTESSGHPILPYEVPASNTPAQIHVPPAPCSSRTPSPAPHVPHSESSLPRCEFPPSHIPEGIGQNNLPTPVCNPSGDTVLCPFGRLFSSISEDSTVRKTAAAHRSAPWPVGSSELHPSDRVQC